ncbi:MAG: undecaprenyldiphospho-muramoylpentapeptide beta-N-acetylglucosaminyltransferase [Pseudomonadota bacterium]|nr:undecaprenyldiphospho-muramoylpentapeptide beta-N-acetylglucosaminyltransferase [Pseudomonadota bacterium]
MSTLMIMAGGTGGHVYPALAVAHTLQADGVNIFWLGTRQGIEARIVPENGIDVEWISISGIKGRGLLALVSAPFKIAYAMLQTAAIIYRRRPAAALGMGGFVSGPGGLTASLLRVPLLIHESNAVVGLTNKWLAKIASEVLVGFPEVLVGSRHHHYVGNPVRDSIAALPEPEQRLQGRTGRLHLLIVGGSRGAQVLNELVPAALARMDSSIRPLVRHQAGSGKLEATIKLYDEFAVEVNCSEYIDDMAAAYEWADLVICRAGAMTVAEIAAAGVAAIFVPYPYAIYDHQTLNARFLSDKKAAILIPQERFSAESLASVLVELANDRPCLAGLSRRARRNAKTDATRRVAELCNEVMHA